MTAGWFAAMACMAVLVAGAPAAEYTWDNGGGDLLWSTAANWDDAGVDPVAPPAAGDTAVFGTPAAPGVVAVDVDSNPTVGTVSFRNSSDGYSLQGPASILTVGRIEQTALAFAAANEIQTAIEAAAFQGPLAIDVQAGKLTINGQIGFMSAPVVTGAVAVGAELVIDGLQGATQPNAMSGSFDVGGKLKLLVAGGATNSPIDTAAINLTGGTLELTFDYKAGLIGNYFKSHSETTVPDQATMASWTPDNTTIDTTINFANIGDTVERRADLGWTGYKTNYAINWLGQVYVATPTLVTFTTNSDDGSMLWVDGQLVVDNNYNHGMQVRTGQIFLGTGYHDLNVGYQQGGGGHGVIVQWDIGAGLVNLPASNLFHLDGGSNVATLGNDVNVTASSVINAFGDFTMGALTIDPATTLQVNGGTARFTSTTVTGSGTVTLDTPGSISLGMLNDGSATVVVEKTGAGDLIAGETTLVGDGDGTTINVTAGRIVIAATNGGNDPLGGATVNLSASMRLSSKAGNADIPTDVNVIANSSIVAGKSGDGAATGVTVSMTGALDVAAGTTLTTGSVDGYLLDLAGTITGTGNLVAGPGRTLINTPSSSLSSLVAGADSELRLVSADSLSASSVVAASAGGFLNIATAQNTPPVATSGGGVTIQPFGALGGDLTGFDFDPISGTQNVFVTSDPVLLPTANAPTRTALGGAIAWRGIDDLAGTYSDLGDNGEDTIYRGVIIGGLYSPTGAFTGTLNEATTGTPAGFDIYLTRTTEFNGVLNSTNPVNGDWGAPGRMNLRGWTGTATTLNINGEAPTPGNMGDMGNELFDFANQQYALKTGQTVNINNSLISFDGQTGRDDVMQNGSVLNINANSMMYLDRQLNQGTVNINAGGMIRSNTWNRFIVGTTYNFQTGSWWVIDYGDNDFQWFVRGPGVTSPTAGVNIVLSGDNTGINHATQDNGLKMGNGTVVTTAWGEGNNMNRGRITPLAMDGSVDWFRFAAPVGRDLTFSNNGATTANVPATSPVINLSNDVGDATSRALLVVGYGAGEVTPYLPQNGGSQSDINGTRDVVYQQPAMTGDVRLRQGTYTLGDIEIRSGRLFLGSATIGDVGTMANFDISGTITAKAGGRLSISTGYNADAYLYTTSAVKLGEHVLERGSIADYNIRNTTAVGGVGTFVTVDQPIVFSGAGAPGGVVELRFDHNEGFSKGNGTVNLDANLTTQMGYYFTDVTALEGAKVEVRQMSNIDRRQLRMDLTLAGNAQMGGDNNWAFRNITNPDAGTAAYTLMLGDVARNTWTNQNSIYGAVGDDVTLDLQRANVFLMPGSSLAAGAVINNVGNTGPGGIGQDGFVRVLGGSDGNVAQRLMAGTINLSGRQDVRLEINDVAAGDPLWNELGTRVNILNQGTYFRSINSVDEIINGWISTGRTMDSTDTTVSGRGYYRNVHIQNGATLEIQRDDGTHIYADLFLDGATARLVNTNNDNENHIMNITGTGDSTLTMIGTSRTRFGGTMTGVNMIWNNTNCFHAEDGFRLGGNTVALARAWMDMYSDPGAGTIDLLNATGNNQLYHGRDKYVAGSGDFLYEWGDGTVIVAGSQRQLVLHSDSIPLAERGPNSNDQFAPRFVNQFNGTVIVANTSDGYDLELRGQYRQTDGVNYHGGVRFNDVRLDNGAEIRFTENWCFVYMNVSLMGGLGTSGTISNYGGWDGGMWVENISGNPDIAGDETMYLGGTAAFQAIGQVSGANLVKTNTNNVRLRPGFDLNGQTLDVRAGWMDWFTDIGSGTLLLNVGNQADNTGSMYVYHGGSAADTIGDDGWGSGLTTAMSHNSRIMLYNIDEPTTAGVANVNKFEAAITISNDGDANTTDARLSADRGVNSDGIAIGHFTNVTVAAGARVGVQRQEDARMKADLYLEGDIGIRSIGDSYSILTLHSTGDDKLVTITKEGGGNATIDLTFDGAVDAFLDSTDTGAIRILGMNLNGRTFTLARSGTQYTAEMWPSAPDPGAGTIRVEGFFNGTSYEGLGLEIRRGEDGSLPAAITGATTIEVANGRMVRGFIRENTTQLTQNIEALVHVIADGNAGSTDAVLRSRKSDVADQGDVVGLVKFANVMLDAGAKLEIGQQDNAYIQIGGFGDGLITLLGDATINNTAGARGRIGDLTGAGALTIQGGQTTFSGVLASAGLNAETDVVIGASALLGLTGPMDVAYGKTLTVNSAGYAAGLTSEGIVDLDPGIGRSIGITGPVANDGIMNVKSGVVDMSTSVMTSTGLKGIVAGLTAGKLAGDFNITEANPGVFPVLYPVAAATSAFPPWADQTTWVYTGEFNWVGGEISFAEHIDDNTILYIDGVEVGRDNTWNTVGSFNIPDLSAGWHQFEVRFGNGGGGAGPNTGNVAPEPVWTAAHGFGYKAGAPTLVQADYTFPVDPGDGSLFRTQATLGILSVADGAELRVAGFQGLNAVVLDGQIAITGPTSSVSTTESLTMGVNAKLDLGMGGLVIDYEAGADVSAILAAYAAGRNGGQWDGATGITSSVVAGDSEFLTAIGIIINEDPNYGGRDTFMGQTVDATSILIRYTWRGDANLDGAVTADDYDVIDNTFVFGVAVGSTMGWWSGDFNGDGVVDSNDYDWIDNAFVFGGTPLGGAAPVGLAVPEPATLALLGFGLAAMAIRRRRSSK
jgi:hypothetical protein